MINSKRGKYWVKFPVRENPKAPIRGTIQSNSFGWSVFELLVTRSAVLAFPRAEKPVDCYKHK
ncbi:hypothetical protein [Aquimarina celericrescens]|uniref:Uncharacterized protein n=1 Tax=Aquimarina celericrescens TaxID=1964542 RepID=A0ABW5ASL7_9FLAO